MAHRAAGTGANRAGRGVMALPEIAARAAIAARQIARGFIPGGAGAAGDVVLRLQEKLARTFGGVLARIAGEDVENSDGTYSLY